MRPAYQLLFSQFGPEQDRDKAIALAASIEMLHTATLIHDDIVDEADLRVVSLISVVSLGMSFLFMQEIIYSSAVLNYCLITRLP